MSDIPHWCIAHHRRRRENHYRALDMLQAGARESYRIYCEDERCDPCRRSWYVLLLSPHVARLIVKKVQKSIRAAVNGTIISSISSVYGWEHGYDVWIYVYSPLQVFLLSGICEYAAQHRVACYNHDLCPGLQERFYLIAH